MTEQLSNLARSTLASGIDNTTDPVPLVLVSGADFPSSGDFRVVVTDGINTELMLGTARSSDTITATRAQEGTTKHAFSTGATVAQVLTKAGLQALLAEHVDDATGAHAASAIAFTPAGSVAATDVQAAILEAAHEGGSTGISILDGGNAAQVYDGGTASTVYPSTDPKLDGGSA